MNPLLQPFDTPFHTVPFDKIKTEHFLPAIEEAIKQGKAEIDEAVHSEEAPSFSNTIEHLEHAGELLDRISTIFFNLNSAETNDEIQALAQKISPLLTEYGNDILLNEKLFKRVKAVHDQKDSLDLNPEELTLLEKSYKGFVRNGALLSDSDKEKLRAIDKELSSLSLKFGENVLKETNAFSMEITDEADLAGLPESTKEMAKMTAQQKGKEGWVFTLDYPSYVPFMTYADNRALREKLYRAFSSRAFKDNEFNNSEIVKKIVNLRQERAELLGYKTHAHFVLEERMAESPDKVNHFLNDLKQYAKPSALKELEDLKAFAKSLGGPEDLQRWDSGYYTEKLKKERFSIDDEMLKPYFQLEKVVDGVFKTANKLFGLSFKENKDIPVYHEEVTAYEVTDESGKHVAVFYADFFPREGKRAGAWMTSYRPQKKVNGKDIRPHVSNVCNFTKPTATKPSLLTFNEVTTLFHEFGHGLHGMLADGTYPNLSGTSVFWDFVELPSQILENWCFEKECLDLFASHYETHEPIPAELVQKLKDSATFMEGSGTLRQISFGLLDMAWHGQDNHGVESVDKFEHEAMDDCNLLPNVAGSNMSCSFSHIFQGGYSSGYYSYKWAEVLDADAFELFKEKGIFDRETADSFRENILSKGGSEHPMILYKRFRKHEPDVKALLRRAGLIS